MTDFYDLFAFAGRPTRIIDFIRLDSADPGPSFLSRRNADFEVGLADRAILVFPAWKPSNGFAAAVHRPRATKIEAGINFTVRRGKETLQRVQAILATGSIRPDSCITRRCSLTKDL